MNFLLYLFIFCCIFQIGYQLALIVVIIKHKSSKNLDSKNLRSVSVVICAKNEAENLQKNLPFILNQNYPNFEVIIVDDGSDERLTIDYERLTIIRIEKNEKIGLGKKNALLKGIQAAKNELILLTDADCRPPSENWIFEMANCITNEKKIVLGISPYKIENTILNGLIEYETAQTALQYIGFALLGNPYMSVGRNVLYERSLLLQKKWTDKELSIASGDDDLTIQTLATAENTTICFSKNSYTISEAKKSWEDFIKQKLRHYESGRLYKLSHRLLLGFYLFSKLFIYFNILFFFIRSILIIDYPTFFFFPFSFYLVYLFFSTFFNLLLNKIIQLNSRWYFTFLNDFLYCISTISLGLISQLKTIKDWK